MNVKDNIRYTIINQLRKKMELNRFCRAWRKRNLLNNTSPNNIFPIDAVSVGNFSYGELNIITFNNKSKLIIGNFVSIAQNVTFLLDVEHYTNHISTYPFKVQMLHSCAAESFSKGDIIIDDDVWIGYGASILSGVHVGQGAIIASGAVVTKNIPPYAIVCGVPAKITKYRFPEMICEQLMKIDYTKITEDFIRKNIDLFYKEINDVEMASKLISLIQHNE